MRYLIPVERKSMSEDKQLLSIDEQVSLINDIADLKKERDELIRGIKVSIAINIGQNNGLTDLLKDKT